MGVSDRKARDRALRHDRIIATAATLAENEGWEAMTIRRLAAEIEYSQPVIYSHFSSREDIVAAVALSGFRELSQHLQAAANVDAFKALSDTATAYLDFASGKPAVYAAMFVMPTRLRFAADDTPAELRAGFDCIAKAVAPFCKDAGLAAEAFWSALHGMAELERAGRIPAKQRSERIALVVSVVSRAHTHAAVGGKV